MSGAVDAAWLPEAVEAASDSRRTSCSRAMTTFRASPPLAHTGFTSRVDPDGERGQAFRDEARDRRAEHRDARATKRPSPRTTPPGLAAADPRRIDHRQ